MDNDPIINAAYRDIASTDAQIKQAETYIKILAGAGEDVTTQRSNLEMLKIRRQKYLDSLRQAGAVG